MPKNGQKLDVNNILFLIYFFPTIFQKIFNFFIKLVGIYKIKKTYKANNMCPI